MIRYFLLGLFFLINTEAQNFFEYDYARFYSPSDSTGYLEIYYSFFRPALQSKIIDGSEKKQVNLFIKIRKSDSRELLVDKEWNLEIPEKSDEQENLELLVGQLDYPLEFGNYQVELIAYDFYNQKNRVSSNFELQLSKQSYEALLVSDIELATKIIPQAENTESIFYKNSVEVTPNPSLIYGDTNPVIFFYSEIYGLSGKIGDKYLVEQKLFDSKDKVVFEKSRNVTGLNSSIVEIGAIKVNELNSGIYQLIVSIKSSENSFSAHSVKKIYVYNRNLVDATTDFTSEGQSLLESELMMMSEEELNYMYETAKYIATEMEQEQWEKLSSIDAKKNFLLLFWNNRDTNVKSPINEYKQEYYERVKYANKTFGNLSRREGWKTDRGRVFISYGKPNEIERYQNEYNSEPYEIWRYYDIEGGVIFLFADEEGLNIYRLVHSTKKGELYNYSNYLKYVQ